MSLPAPKRSLGTRLLLFLGGLLLVVLTTFAWVSYRQLQETLVEGAADRMAAVAGRVAGLLEGSASRIESGALSLARDPAIARFAADPNDSTARAAAQAALASAEEAAPQIMGILVEPSGGGDAVRVGEEAPPAGAGAGATAGVGPIQGSGTRAFYDVTMPFSGGGGVLVLRRSLSNPESARQIADLIGERVALRLGTAGGPWTDLGTLVAGPPDSLARAGGGSYQPEGQGAVLGAASPVAGTPWMLWVETPRSAALAPARAVLGNMAGLGALVLLAGLGGAIVFGRSLTRPLLALTHAAERISQGDLSGRVPVESEDEVGRLAAAFNVMVEEVEASQHRLEERVRSRTEELEKALADLHDAQERLVRKEKLATLGQLASGVGHELRNPLGVMTNALYYLDIRLADAPGDALEYLGILKAQVALSSRIVGDLLDFSRVKEPRRERVAASEIVENQIARLAESDSVAVRREIPKDLPPVSVDPVQVGQVLFNLLTNAVQAMGDAGGTLTVAAGEGPPGKVWIEVRDTGPGIPPENLERIFEPLFTTRARGIGLGLSVSRSLVEANDGTIEASSVPGQGARFRIAFPAVETEVAA